MTDNLPLRWIISPSKDLPTMASARVQRWAMQLRALDFSIEHRKSQDMGPADMLSRLNETEAIVETVNLINLELNSLPLSYVLIAYETQECPVLSKVTDCIRNG